MQACKVFAKQNQCVSMRPIFCFTISIFAVSGWMATHLAFSFTIQCLSNFYSEGQCCKIRSMQHWGISAAFFFNNRVCIALLLPERFQITNDTTCIRSSDKRPPLSEAHLDAQVPSKAEEVIWDWASQKNPLDQMVSIKRGVKLPQMLRAGRRSSDMAVVRRGELVMQSVLVISLWVH